MDVIDRIKKGVELEEAAAYGDPKAKMALNTFNAEFAAEAESRPKAKYDRDGVDFVISADERGRVVYWTQEAQDALGLSEKEAVDSPVERCLFPKSEWFAGRRIVNEALQGVGWQGRPNEFNLCFVPLADDDGTVRGLMIEVTA